MHMYTYIYIYVYICANSIRRTRAQTIVMKFLTYICWTMPGISRSEVADLIDCTYTYKSLSIHGLFCIFVFEGEYEYACAED